MPSPARRPLPAVALLLLGCAGASGAVRVSPLGATAAPRAPGCPVELLEKEPTRPFERLAEMIATAPSLDGQAALSVLREPACRLGADALVITHRTTPRGAQSMVAAVAIRWLPEPPPGEASGARSL